MTSVTFQVMKSHWGYLTDQAQNSVPKVLYINYDYDKFFTISHMFYHIVVETGIKVVLGEGDEVEPDFIHEINNCFREDGLLVYRKKI